MQGIAAVILLLRLLPGIRREPAVAPAEPIEDTSVTVLVPTLNEAERLTPCLRGLGRQGPPLMEVIVVDSGSTDGTPALVDAAARDDARVRLAHDPPRDPGWIGKVWALQHGLSLARGEWILGVDADTEANAGMVAGVVHAARTHSLELVSFSPMFAEQTAGERLLQPSLLASLVYRTGAPEPLPAAERLLANGQCFLVRRDVLLAHGGYAAARASFADDVTLARHLASAGVRCGFLDGRRLFRVRSYRSAGEMWREWGRSVDLSDATSRLRQRIELLFLLLVQGLPLPVLVVAMFAQLPAWLIDVNALLVGMRIVVLFATARSYEVRGVPYYASWLTDPAAWLRIAISTFRRPVRWRGRTYDSLA
jgi:dolichol-phosphate mannosyltransferase